MVREVGVYLVQTWGGREAVSFNVYTQGISLMWDLFFTLPPPPFDFDSLDRSLHPFIQSSHLIILRTQLRCIRGRTNPTDVVFSFLFSTGIRQFVGIMRTEQIRRVVSLIAEFFFSLFFHKRTLLGFPRMT